jgi:hypothetical protein
VNQDALIPCFLELDENPKPNRKWARVIQKIYEVDPPICPKCQGAMRIISFIEEPEVIKKILEHLGLWQTNQRPPPKAKREPYPDYSESQLPFYQEVLDHDPGVSLDRQTI